MSTAKRRLAIPPRLLLLSLPLTCCLSRSALQVRSPPTPKDCAGVEVRGPYPLHGWRGGAVLLLLAKASHHSRQGGRVMHTLPATRTRMSRLVPRRLFFPPTPCFESLLLMLWPAHLAAPRGQAPAASPHGAVHRCFNQQRASSTMSQSMGAS